MGASQLTKCFENNDWEWYERFASFAAASRDGKQSS